MERPPFSNTQEGRVLWRGRASKHCAKWKQTQNLQAVWFHLREMSRKDKPFLYRNRVVRIVAQFHKFTKFHWLILLCMWKISNTLCHVNYISVKLSTHTHTFSGLQTEMNSSWLWVKKCKLAFCAKVTVKFCHRLRKGRELSASRWWADGAAGGENPSRGVGASDPL